MKSVLLIGLGRFGLSAAKKLHELGHQVMAVDRDPARVEMVLPYVTSALIGDSTREDFLRSVGVSDYDLCICAIGDDFQSSLETTSLLHELGGRRVIARASRSVHEKFLLRNGADEVVYPERQVAQWTAIRYSSDHIFDYIAVDEDYAVFELELPGDWVGRTIGELSVRQRFGVTVVALRREGSLLMDITADTRLCGGDTLLVLGRSRQVQRAFHL